MNLLAIPNYFPLTIGNYWEYDNNYKYQIFSDSVINGKQFFKYGKSEEFPDYYLRNDNSGNIYAYSFALSEEYLWLDFNMGVGDTCIYNNGYDTYYAEIIEDSISIETEVGIFNNCKLVICYIPNMVDSDIWYYFAPDVGIVKMLGAWLPSMKLIDYEIDISTKIESITKPQIEYSFDCFPNPFKNKVNISVNIEQTTNCNITIYNQNGQLVEYLHSGILEIGKHELFWIAKDIIPDLYFIILHIGDKRITHKVVLLE